MLLFEEGMKFPDPFFPFHNYFFSIVALLSCGLNRTALVYLFKEVYVSCRKLFPEKTCFCIGFVEQRSGVEGWAIGVASVRRCQKLP